MERLAGLAKEGSRKHQRSKHQKSLTFEVIWLVDIDQQMTISELLEQVEPTWLNFLRTREM